MLLCLIPVLIVNRKECLPSCHSGSKNLSENCLYSKCSIWVKDIKGVGGMKLAGDFQLPFSYFWSNHDFSNIRVAMCNSWISIKDNFKIWIFFSNICASFAAKPGYFWLLQGSHQYYKLWNILYNAFWHPISLKLKKIY